MQETLDNKNIEKNNKKEKKISKKEQKRKIEKRNKIISIILIVISLLSIAGLTLGLVLHNMYQSGKIGEFDSSYTVKYNTFMTQKENVYYVYFYIEDDANCKNTKENILAYQRSIAQKDNAPVYTYEISKDLYEFLNVSNGYSVANLNGITRETYREAKLGDVPCLALVRRQDGMQTIMSYVIGQESIDAQLKLNVNYEKYLS